MGYNWKEKFKSKSDNELYDIYLGSSYQADNAMFWAEQELKSRNFNFDKNSKSINKWKLQKIYEEERDEKQSFFNRKITAKEHLIGGIIGSILVLIFTLNLFFDFLEFSSEQNNQFDKTIPILVGVFFTIYGFVGYKRTTKKDEERKEQIDKLIEEI